MEDESIYSLIPPAKKEIKKDPLHKSKSYELDSSFGNSKTGGGMGPKKSVKPSPSQFLKRQEKKLPEPKKFSYGERQKPALAAKTEQGTIKRKGPKNFLKENAQTAAHAAKKTTRQDVDYRHKSDYGKVPAYLEQVKQEVASEQEWIRSMVESQKEKNVRHKPGQHLLAEEDRLELLAALKVKFEAVNREYQSMTHIVDMASVTLRKKERKAHLERELDELEKTMDKLSRKNVYVSD